MKKLIAIIVLLAGCAPRPVQQHVPVDKPVLNETNKTKPLPLDEQALQLSLSRPVLMDFGAPWCHYCRQMEPIIDSIGKDYTVFKINTDEHPDLKDKYNIRGLPTFLIFRNREIVGNFVGAASEAAIREKLKEARR